MSSILTNTSAMTALQTLRTINSNLAKAQNDISTGRAIATAKDNAAVWSISKVMQSDVNGINAIKSSLDLGEASVSVARQAAESIESNLQSIQSLVISAQAKNVDRATLQGQIDKLVSSIEMTVNNAQFNGLNFLNGSSDEEVSVLASLNRDSNGAISTSSIAINRMSMSFVAPDDVEGGEGAPITPEVTPPPQAFSEGSELAETDIDPEDGNIKVIIQGIIYNPGDKVSLSLGNSTNNLAVTYIVKENDTSKEIAAGLKTLIEGSSDFASFDGDITIVDDDQGGLTFTNSSEDTTYKISGSTVAASTTPDTPTEPAAPTVGLIGLDNLDVTTAENAVAAMNAITGYLSFATQVASYYGSTESQISGQSNFMSTLADAMTTGIGSLVDADMEEASARLTALQTQQQLGIQALSIANQTPQTILSLFR